MLPLSGCLGGDAEGTSLAKNVAAGSEERPQDASRPGATPNASVGQAPRLDFTRCAELNFLLPIPAEDVHAPSGLKVKTVDPAGLVANLLVTGMKCERLGVREATVETPSALFMMVAVEPVVGAPVPDAVAYFWLGFAGSVHNEIRLPFQDRGVEAENVTVSLAFQDVGGNAKMRGTMTAKFEDGFEGHADSQMLGAPFSGASGTLGLYTVSDREPLRAHAVHFSNYKGYERGAAIIDPGFLPIPVDAPGPATATHNLDYDVGFELDVLVKET